MDLTLAHVRTLREVARLGSFSRAADLLHLSQPAVSLHVRLLEERVGLRLLDRVGKRAVPTPAADVLLAHATRVFDELEAARQALERLRGVVAGRVRIGTGATASVYLLPPVLRRLRTRHPRLELIVVTGNAPEIAAAVAHNDLDLGVVTMPVRHRRLVAAPLVADHLVAIAPPGHPGWPRGRDAGAEELARHPLILYERGGAIRQVIDDWFRRGGAAPRVVMELGNAEAIKRLVEAGLGVAVTSAMSVRAEARARSVLVRPLRPRLHRGIGLVRRRDKPASPALDVVVGALEGLRAIRSG